MLWGQSSRNDPCVRCRGRGGPLRGVSPYTCVCIICVYIYIYRERDRYRERDTYIIIIIIVKLARRRMGLSGPSSVTPPRGPGCASAAAPAQRERMSYIILFVDCCPDGISLWPRLALSGLVWPGLVWSGLCLVKNLCVAVMHIYIYIYI